MVALDSIDSRHIIAASFGAFLCFDALAHALSVRFSASYRALPAIEQSVWLKHVHSLVHALVASAFSIVLVPCTDVLLGRTEPAVWITAPTPVSPLATLALCFSYGYWIHDTVFGVRALRDAPVPDAVTGAVPSFFARIRSRDVLFHHILCLAAAHSVLYGIGGGGGSASPYPLLALLLTESPNVFSHSEGILKAILTQRDISSNAKHPPSHAALRAGVKLTHTLKSIGYVLFRVVYVNLIVVRFNEAVYRHSVAGGGWHAVSTPIRALLVLSWVFGVLGLYWVAIVACPKRDKSKKAH